MMSSGQAHGLREGVFWDGVAWAIRWLIAAGHLIFLVPCFFRAEILETLPAYRLFTELWPFSAWGGLSFLGFSMLLAVPTRVPWGLLSTGYSAGLWFLIAVAYSTGLGFVFGSMTCYGLGALSCALFMRSLWAYAVRVAWFQEFVLKERGSA